MNDNDGSALRIADHAEVTCNLSNTALQPSDKTSALTRVKYLERELFDDSGHLRRGMTPERADETVALINHLRRALGWLEIDLEGRWLWPAASDRGERMTGLPAERRGSRRRRLGNQPRESECGERKASRR
jgi:hypothetical protein